MSQFQIFSAKQIAHLREGGAILRQCLEEVSKLAVPGATTLELDEFAERFIRERGGLPGFKNYHGYPATLCTSINDECVHGIPGSRKLADGDIVGIDCGVIFGGLYTDACVTVPVGKVAEGVLKFLELSREALERACAIVKAGARVGDLSSMIQKTVEGAGFNCVNGLTGHGLGSTLHQFPDIPNVGRKGTGPIFPADTIIAIEPITTMGNGRIREGEDGWTIKTADGALSAHYEHTVLVLQNGMEILA